MSSPCSAMHIMQCIHRKINSDDFEEKRKQKQLFLGRIAKPIEFLFIRHSRRYRTSIAVRHGVANICTFFLPRCYFTIIKCNITRSYRQLLNNIKSNSFVSTHWNKRRGKNEIKALNASKTTQNVNFDCSICVLTD